MRRPTVCQAPAPWGDVLRVTRVWMVRTSCGVKGVAWVTRSQTCSNAAAWSIASRCSRKDFPLTVRPSKTARASCHVRVLPSMALEVYVQRHAEMLANLGEDGERHRAGGAQAGPTLIAQAQKPLGLQ
jgi:hypothetical protein